MAGGGCLHVGAEEHPIGVYYISYGFWVDEEKPTSTVGYRDRYSQFWCWSKETGSGQKFRMSVSDSDALSFFLVWIQAVLGGPFFGRW